jgi:endonuclease G
MTNRLEQIVRARIKACEAEITHSLQMALKGQPLAAETDDKRMLDRVQAKMNVPRSIAETIARTVRSYDGHAEATGAVVDEFIDTYMTTRPFQAGRRTRAAFAAGAEKIIGETEDFVNVSFLTQGARAARTVGRVAYRDRRPQGSGFLIGNGLFLTNHHVVEDEFDINQFVLEFDYELDLAGNPRAVSRFNLDPVVFITDPIEGLDYTIVAVGGQIDGTEPIETFGQSRLSDAGDKHMLGEAANIVQHPQGRYKEVVLRENHLVSRFENALHYVADTEPGSSGSPVFNNQWQAIALHHWGGPWIQRTDAAGNPLSMDINEGIRISSIVKDARSRLQDMEPVARQRLAGALEFGETVAQPAELEQPRGGMGTTHARIEQDGRVTWTVPLEISVNLPSLAGPGSNISPASAISGIASGVPEKRKRIEDYSDRRGYKPLFLDGHTVSLPKLSRKLRAKAAVNIQTEPGDDRHELKYHHFSVVVNRQRKLAFFTACNIDGATAKSVNRRKKTVKPLTAGSAGLESTASPEDAEASDTWYLDPRLDKADYAGPEIYAGQKVPGFADPRSRGRIARMFQRGHLVRRLDPAWGSDERALEAERDTFHWTNCSPQVGFFNQGSADAALDGTGGGRLWRAVENYVLRNAVAENQRVNSFTGPIFDDKNDRPYRSIKIPGKFFKIVVWVEDGELKSLAMIADQAKVYSAWPEAIFSEAVSVAESEAFQEPDELEKVADFLTTVAEVEKLTGVDFGKNVRKADVRKGQQRERIRQAADIDNSLEYDRGTRSGKKGN